MDLEYKTAVTKTILFLRPLSVAEFLPENTEFKGRQEVSINRAAKFPET